MDPTQWLAHYGSGVLAVDDGEYQDAIRHFSRAQRLAPRRPEIYFYRAVALYYAGQNDEAIRDMSFVLTLLEQGDRRRKDAEHWLTLFRE
jgi:Flp pilus assembly protein TadD